MSLQYVVAVGRQAEAWISDPLGELIERCSQLLNDLQTKRRVGVLKGPPLPPSG